MRARLVLAIGLALASACPSIAAASHDPSGAPLDQDFAVGSGTSFLAPQFRFEVRGGPSGENPTGTVAFDLGGIFVEGPVTCLGVQGNRANFVFLPTIVPIPLKVDVTDKLGSSPDELTLGQAGGTACGAPFQSGTVINSGDIVVHDAPALPTSKDQCKNGGWRNFGVFKNEGDCVSFVTTKGKSQPSGP
jgi:hypothetical protein